MATTPRDPGEPAKETPPLEAYANAVREEGWKTQRAEFRDNARDITTPPLSKKPSSPDTPAMKHEMPGPLGNLVRATVAKENRNKGVEKNIAVRAQKFVVSKEQVQARTPNLLREEHQKYTNGRKL
jgi:hypothetical protein